MHTVCVHFELYSDLRFKIEDRDHLKKNSTNNHCYCMLLFAFVAFVLGHQCLIVQPMQLSYSLAPAQNEGHWHEMPIAVRNHMNTTGGGARFWRKNKKHPSNTFVDVVGLSLDLFSVALWVKVDPQFWQTFRSGVFWELGCSNCGDPQATWSQEDYAKLRQQQQNDLNAQAASDDCPIHIRLEATPQQAIVRTIAPENQALSTCAPVPQQIQIINGDRKIADGKWHHVAVVFDTTSAQVTPTLHQRSQGVLGTDYRLELWVDGVLDGTAEGPQNLKLLTGRLAGELTVGRTRTDGKNNAYGSPNAIASGIDSMGFMQSSMSTLEIRDTAMGAVEIQRLAKVNCAMSAWTEWSQCQFESSTSAPATIRQRTRTILRHPLNGGTVCSSNMLEEKSCGSLYEM